MTSYTKEQMIEKKQKKITYALFIPIILLLTIVPLIVKLKVVNTSDVIHMVFRSNEFIDFYSQYKGSGIIGITLLMLITLFLLFDKKFLKKDKIVTISSIGACIFLLFTILSTTFSPYQDVAMWGVPDRAEGMIVIICYIVIMSYTLYAFVRVDDYKYIIYALSVLVIVSTIIGFLQYIGRDFYMSELGKKLMIPEEYADIRNSLTTNFEKQRITISMFNPNYVGSFTAIMIPLFGVLGFFAKTIKEIIFFTTIMLCNVFLLFGSGSRAGILGIMAAVIFAIVIFAKKIWHAKKAIFPIIGGGIVILVILVISTRAIMFDKINTMMQDAISLFLPADANFDYKNEVLVKDIHFEDGKAIVVGQKGDLILENTSEGIKMYDDSGATIAYEIENNLMKIEDNRFDEFVFERLFRTDDESKLAAVGLVLNERPAYLLKVTDDEGIYLVDSFTQEKIDMDYAEAIGFKGKELLASGRGYIWSRSIPLLKNTVILGTGPDTYVLFFPQNDFVAKDYSLGNPIVIVDKPHNMYLQIGINQGLIALIGFLILVISYVIDSLKLYAFKNYYNTGDAVGVASVLAVIGYLIAGIFNDSVVSVAPIFWVVLGMGIGINYIRRKQGILN